MTTRVFAWIAVPVLIGGLLFVSITEPTASLAAAVVSMLSISTDSKTTSFQELSAKRWLLKHDPSGSRSFGMFHMDQRTQQDILRDEQKLAQTAADYVNAHPDIAKFLGKDYGVSDVTIYQTIQKMNLIQLTKTRTGFTYEFKGGGGCFVENYTGTLMMNGNVVISDDMKMRMSGVPC